MQEPESRGRSYYAARAIRHPHYAEADHSWQGPLQSVL
jgi:hypothetical protein